MRLAGGNLRDAATFYRAAIALFPRDMQARSGLVVALARGGQCDDASEALANAEVACPGCRTESPRAALHPARVALAACAPTEQDDR
jgi:hypothetical protein